MKILIVVLIVFVSVLKCFGQIPLLNSFSGQSSGSPQINISYKDDSLTFMKEDSIIYNLNFIPDSVSKIIQNDNFHILNFSNSSSTITVNNQTEKKSTYKYIFTPIISNNFNFLSPIFYKNGKAYTADIVQIKLKHKDLTDEDIRQGRMLNLKSNLIKQNDALYIVIKEGLSCIGIWKDNKFEIIRELNKKQVEDIEKIIQE